jgi:hypothetical protein
VTLLAFVNRRGRSIVTVKGICVDVGALVGAADIGFGVERFPSVGLARDPENRPGWLEKE